MKSSWQSLAACIAPGIDPNIFFTSVEGHTPRGWEKQAKRVCGRCQVTRECVEAALEDGATDGIWGGLTAWERYAMGGARPRSGKPRMKL
ncbi:WhiB family transcriptional regulator [Streptomyces sp. NPDC057909]|uniref:WhiB family transcriptional regulator n=1 Tax=Streptomyces sp. NPDC057909 TaxID=3346277 RepID=UPI0036E2B4A4